MMRLILRRTAADATAEDEVVAAVSSSPGRVLDVSDGTMLATVDNVAAVASLRNSIRGWAIAEQGAKIELPDTRLKVVKKS